ASETRRVKRSSSIGTLRLYPMAGSRTDLTSLDMQASSPDVRLGLTRAGVTGVQKAIRIRHEGHEKTFAAEISCTVDLDPEQRAHPLSRRLDLSGTAIAPRARGGLSPPEPPPDHTARHIVERQQALRAEVHIRAQYPLERRTPVTDLPTQEIATLIGIAAAS